MTNLKKHNDKYNNYILFFTQMIMTNIMTKKPMFSVASRVPHPLRLDCNWIGLQLD